MNATIASTSRMLTVRSTTIQLKASYSIPSAPASLTWLSE